MNLFETDVLIVGAGPAGLAAAIELRKRGVGRVTVVDREREPGGIPRHSDHIGFGLRDMHRFLSGPAFSLRAFTLTCYDCPRRSRTALFGLAEGGNS